MIEIRVAKDIRSTVYISGPKLRLPSDYSWVVLPQIYWLGNSSGANDLYRAFDQGLIEVRVSNQEVFPNWYLDVIAHLIQLPEDFLDSDEVVHNLRSLCKDAPPPMWAAAKRELYIRELSGLNRTHVLELLQ